MFFQPIPQRFIHAGLPPFTSGLEGCKNISIKAHSLRLFHSTAKRPPRLFGKHLVSYVLAEYLVQNFPGWPGILEIFCCPFWICIINQMWVRFIGCHVLSPLWYWLF